MKVSERLMDKNLFVIPLQTGLRFALCAVSEEKCKVAPKIIKEVMMECDE